MTRAFRLQLHDEGLASLIFDLPEKKVNVFTRGVLSELDGLLGDLADRADIRALILRSGKRDSFIAGFDVGEIAAVTDPQEVETGVRLGQDLFQRWHSLPFPTIVAVQGTCLGGGTELALASDVILLSDRDDIRIGLPEVRLGIIPAWGGSTRLPRRIGVTAALDIILAGKAVRPAKALRIGLADALIPDAVFLPQVRRLALATAAGEPPRRRRRSVKSRLLESVGFGRSLLFQQARKRALEKTGGHYPAPLRAIEVIETGLRRGLEAGLEAEVRATSELAVSPVSKNLIHVFNLMEASKREPVETEGRDIRSVAVIGAGVMGGGIAQIIAERARIPVRLKDLQHAPLAQAMAHASELFDRQVERRRLGRADADTRLSLIRPSVNPGLERVDLVIEAIVEDLEIKRALLADLSAALPGTTILASNTSSLTVEDIGQDASERGRIIGMHFFNPVHKMPLVEVVRSEDTDDSTLATVIGFARQLGKTPVIVRDSPGFLVNRLLAAYMTEAMWLLDEGFRIEDIDDSMTGWGMPVGPLALVDEVGIDVALKVARSLSQAFGNRLMMPRWSPELIGAGGAGAESGSIFYRHDKRRRLSPNGTVYGLLSLPEPSAHADSAKLVDRLVLPMVNEAARCLEETIVDTAGDIDLAMVLGTGFPPFRGGLCRWADQQGLGELLEILRRFRDQHGERYEPAAALERLADAGGFYHGATSD